MSDPADVAQQAGMVAAAWSPPGAPASWALTAAQFDVLRADPELLAIAATIPPERLPPLLFTAAATRLVLDLEPEPLRRSFPRARERQPPLSGRFAVEYRAFCLEQSERLLELCASHRYQMNEVGRCADLIAALGPACADGRPLALVDIGTGAGLALHPDRYHYRFHHADGSVRSAGDAGSSVMIETEVRGPVAPPVPARLPPIAERIGIDIEPLDLHEPAVRAWLAACIPQESAAVTRFENAVEISLAQAARSVRGDACDVLDEVLASVPDDVLVCLLDSYVHVFFEGEQLERFRLLVDRAGAERDLDWISIDPLVPMGAGATASVLGLPVPPALIERNRRDGVFGVIGRLSYRRGQRVGSLLGIAHPGAAWLEWLPGPSG